jgi:hypothetical protein
LALRDDRHICSALGSSFHGNFGLSVSEGAIFINYQNFYDYLINSNFTDQYNLLSNSNWHHIAIIKNGPNFSFFIDGNKLQVYSNIPDNITPDNSSPLWIGRFILNGNRFHKGKIDDIYFYNRALSTQEVNYLSTH